MNNTNCNNGTGFENGITLGATLIGIDVCIIAFNLVTIMVIARFRTKNAVDIFVLALAMTDLTKGLVPIPITISVYLGDWCLDTDTPACLFYGWIAFSLNSGSMLLLTLMAIERFGAIIKPFVYRGWVTPRKIQVIAFVAMTFSGLHSALPLVGVGRISPYYKGAYSHFDYSQFSSGTIGYSLFIIFYGFTMIIIVVIAYSFVFYKIRTLIRRHRRMSRVSGRYTTTSRGELNLKTERMFSYLTVALMLVFSCSWLPFLVVVVSHQVGKKAFSQSVDLMSMRVVVINSMLNPLIYAALCKPYRRGILYYFRKCFSLFGFEPPENDIWDPWRRMVSSGGHRRHLEYSGRYRRCDDLPYYSNTDSMCAIPENFIVPPVLQSYDSYRRRGPDGEPTGKRLSPVHENSMNGLVGNNLILKSKFDKLEKDLSANKVVPSKQGNESNGKLVGILKDGRGGSECLIGSNNESNPLSNAITITDSSCLEDDSTSEDTGRYELDHHRNVIKETSILDYPGDNEVTSNDISCNDSDVCSEPHAKFFIGTIPRDNNGNSTQAYDCEESGEDNGKYAKEENAFDRSRITTEGEDLLAPHQLDGESAAHSDIKRLSGDADESKLVKGDIDKGGDRSLLPQVDIQSTMGVTENPTASRVQKKSKSEMDLLDESDNEGRANLRVNKSGSCRSAKSLGVELCEVCRGHSQRYSSYVFIDTGLADAKHSNSADSEIDKIRSKSVEGGKILEDIDGVYVERRCCNCNQLSESKRSSRSEKRKSSPYEIINPSESNVFDEPTESQCFIYSRDRNQTPADD